MVPLDFLADKHVAVFGLGRSGLAACAALHAGGARVWAGDDDPERCAAADGRSAVLVDLNACNWDRLDLLVVSPGVPLTHPKPHPVVRRARRERVRVIGDIELFAQAAKGRTVVGITGTNGKSTTTALLGHMLAACGRSVQVGGNIGVPVLNLAFKGQDDVYVLELSSFQLDLSESLDCTVAVLLNLTPDHLDRHGSMRGYARAKRRLFEQQGIDGVAVLGIDDDHGRRLARALVAQGRRVIPVAVGRAVAGGVWVEAGTLHDGTAGAPRAVARLAGHNGLRGPHNWQNAAAAYGAARALGLSPDAAAAGLEGFAPLPHRLEPVGEFGAVTYINDSKATNPEAAAKSLAGFDAVYWIAGGKSKPGGFAAIEPQLHRVRHAFLIGDAALELRRFIAGRVPSSLSGDLATAVADARAQITADGGAEAVVLLAPACASFDQFKSFEARGAAFRNLVAALGKRPPLLERTS